MLAFIVPLQSSQASKNWQHVCRLVQRTLNSILNQTQPDFRVFLVCNEAPPGLPKHSQLCVVQCNLMAPPVGKGRMADKWLKVHIGLVAARSLTPCHFMVVDADDLVSNRLAAHCAKYPENIGWYFDCGWMHDEGSRLAFRFRRQFYLTCGTSSIVRMARVDLPQDERAGAETCVILRSGHTQIRANMEALGRPLKSLPFIGSVYILGTGENDSSFSLRRWRSKKVFLRKLLNYRWISCGMRREFGLWPLTDI
jgi:hypothetical protein